MKFAFIPYTLQFRFRAITSRSVMTEKTTYFIVAYDDICPKRYGVGECALFKGLSADDRTDYEEKLQRFCADPSTEISGFSSIRFGVETAINDLTNGGRRIIFPSKSLDENCPVKINGLIWMGGKNEMMSRIRKKIDEGFHCVKLKIGGLDFDDELQIIKSIRDTYSTDVLEIRLDANGAFSPSDALSRLDKLSRFGIHSIEQPIRQGQWKEMADICRQSPIPIALDEELIGVSTERQCDLLDIIKPQYIILKPSLCGGFSDAEKWISRAEQKGIKCWLTSALESNVGLNAIAQFAMKAAECHSNILSTQGLGTGNLFLNNIPSPLTTNGEYLTYDNTKKWYFESLTTILPH